MVNNLFSEMQKLGFVQSNGMATIPEMKGPGFFPGCIGTINSNINLKDVDVMVLGQDFDTAENYEDLDFLKFVCYYFIAANKSSILSFLKL